MSIKKCPGSKYKYFNPEDIIKKYFYESIVSEHNETSFLSHNLKKNISNLRKLICEYFSLNEYIVVFLPNLNNVYKLLRHFLNSCNFENLCIHQDNFDFSKFEKPINKFVYVSLDKLLYRLNYSGIEKIDFLTFDPSHAFGIDGLIVFMFKNIHNLKPIYFGSSYHKNVPHSLECGTQNYTNLLLLEAYFDSLLSHRQEIFQNILNTKTTQNIHQINFNKLT